MSIPHHENDSRAEREGKSSSQTGQPAPNLQNDDFPPSRSEGDARQRSSVISDQPQPLDEVGSPVLQAHARTPDPSVEDQHRSPQAGDTTPAGYGQPSGYAPYGAIYHGAETEHPKAKQAMIAGIFALLCSGAFGILGVAGVVLGLQARRGIAASGGRLGGSGKALTGIICGAMGVTSQVIALATQLIRQ